MQIKIKSGYIRSVSVAAIQRAAQILPLCRSIIHATVINTAPLFIAAALLTACDQKPAETPGVYREKCRVIESECSANCIERNFRTCFVDTKLFPNEPYDPVRNCHAAHVGNLCAPCEQIFSVNFGGSMRAVSCVEFLEAVVKKNADKNCQGCLKQVGDSAFDY